MPNNGHEAFVHIVVYFTEIMVSDFFTIPQAVTNIHYALIFDFCRAVIVL